MNRDTHPGNRDRGKGSHRPGYWDTLFPDTFSGEWNLNAELRAQHGILGEKQFTSIQPELRGRVWRF